MIAVDRLVLAVANQRDEKSGRRIPIMPAIDQIMSLKDKLGVKELFELVGAFARERDCLERITDAEKAIKALYNRLTTDEKTIFLSMIYDEFAQKYDLHMGRDTNHYDAMRKLIGFSLQTNMIGYPFIDVTAGTGEMAKYVVQSNGRRGQVIVNEISSKMMELAIAKFEGKHEIEFRTGSAYDLGDEFEGRMRTVLCSQTFHLLSYDDKIKLVRVINELLMPGGIAMILEEDPFRVSNTHSIESVRFFIESVAEPIKAPDILIGMFEASYFTKLEHRAAWPIDGDHVMRLHLFQKISW